MAREAASRTGSFRLERVGAGVIVELRVAPAPGLGKSLAVPRDEVDIVERTWDARGSGRLGALLRLPMNFRELGAIGKRLATIRNAGLISCDHHRIGDDHGHQFFGIADGDNLPTPRSP